MDDTCPANEPQEKDRARLIAAGTVVGMKKNKTWSIIADLTGVALTIVMIVGGWYVGIIGVLVLWTIVHSVVGRSESSGIIGVEQQSKARGKRPRTGNGGVAFRTFWGTGPH